MREQQLSPWAASLVRVLDRTTGTEVNPLVAGALSWSGDLAKPPPAAIRPFAPRIRTGGPYAAAVGCAFWLRTCRRLSACT